MVEPASQFLTYPIDGGLDLLSPKTGVDPGSITDCLNYEVAIKRGLSRMDGYEPFDGGVSPSVDGRFRLVTSFACIGDMTLATGSKPLKVGDRVSVELSSSPTYAASPADIRRTMEFAVYSRGAVTYNSGTNITFFNTTEFVSIGATPSLSETPYIRELVAGTGADERFFRNDQPTPSGVYGTAGAPILTDVADQSLLVSQAISKMGDFYSVTAGNVQPVPGQGQVNGLFWFKDSLYATRDYLSASFTSGTNLPSPGDEVWQGPSYAIASFKARVAAISTTSGAWAGGGNATGTISLYDTQGTFTEGNALKNHNASDVTVCTVQTIGVPAVAAGLYKAEGERGSTVATQSWQRQELGWNVQFKDGVEDFTPLNTALRSADIAPQIQATSWKVPTLDESPVGNYPWLEHTGGSAVWATELDDGATPDYDATYVFQTATPSSGDPNLATFASSVRVMGFGFSDSDIPDGSYITGIEVEVVRRASKDATIVFSDFTYGGATYPGGVYDRHFRLLGLGLVDNIANEFGDFVNPWTTNTNLTDNTPSAWNANPPSVPQKLYGGKQNLLHASNVTPDKIKASDFGVSLGAIPIGASGAGSIRAHITSVRIRVHYLPPSASVYFWNTRSAVNAKIVAAYTQSGSTDTADAAGVLYLSGVGTSRVISGGEQIRLLAGPATPDGGVADGSIFIANTASAANLNAMDCASLLADTSSIDKPTVSKYQHVSANFYASAGLESLFMVSGAGPCAYFDGTNFARIHTGLTLSAEKPRHVCAHQGRLFLAYYAGSVQYSDQNGPLQWDFTLGQNAAANEIGFGSPITGMYQLNGDSLAVFNDNAIHMIQGSVSAGPYQSTIAPKIGCIEYTSASMGEFLFLSHRGVGSLESVKEYGDFRDSPLSQKVWDWLRERVQTSAFFEASDAAPIGVLPVKNKAQYRLYFADGYVLTATFLVPGELPQYTIQKYDTTMRIFCAGTETRGRDRIFASDDAGSGMVYELDRGHSFNGSAFDRYFTLNVNNAGNSYQEKQWQALHVHGIKYDVLTLNVSRSGNYDPIDTASVVHFVNGGINETVATFQPKPFVAFGDSDMSIQGRGINLRIDASSAGYSGKHVIQAVSIRTSPLRERH